MKTSKISLSLTFITMLLVGALMSGETFAHGGPPGRGHPGGGYPGVVHAGGNWHGGGWNRGTNVGIYLGAPIGFRYGYYPYPFYGTRYYGTPYYYPPAYYPPAPSYYSYPLAQPAPVTYIERSDEPQVETQKAPNDSSQDGKQAWWYYCVDAKAYYPYVNQCPGGWLRVAPQPPPSSDGQPASNNSPAP
jgi:hypothetical protein